MALHKTLYIGPFIHCKTLDDLDICPNGLIGVDEDGKISHVSRDAKEGLLPAQGGWEHAKIVRTEQHGFFFPGFIGIYH